MQNDTNIQPTPQQKTRPHLFGSILETVGHTPIVRLNAIAPAHAEIYAKLEAFNPMGSVKDRLALAVIEDAERRGLLRPGQTVIEATSGNTGIGLAMVCAAKGYPLVIVMAESFSIERRRLMRFLGAKVVLTPASEKGSGMLAKAEALAAAHGWFLCRQFENQANARVHYETTAQEILDCFEGERLDYFVTGFGTGGTLNGVAARLKEERPGVRVIACEPDNAPMLSSGIAQPTDEAGKPQSHPLFRPHLMQGWSPDFISPLAQSALRHRLIDGFETIDGEVAMAAAKLLAQREGILAGISSGATLAGAMQLAARAPAGTRILCLLPDTGERYLSTPLFASIDAEMDGDERAISRSTPGYRFDPGKQAEPLPRHLAAPQPAKASIAPNGGKDMGDAALLDDPEAYLDRVIHASQAPVVVFGLAWCEFGWSATRFLDHVGIGYVQVQIDRGAFQTGDRGIRLRKALEQRTGQTTFPQIFVRGEFIGGATDLFEAYRTERLAERLAADGGAKPLKDVDPMRFLPAWIHSRSAAAE